LAERQQQSAMPHSFDIEPPEGAASEAHTQEPARRRSLSVPAPVAPGVSYQVRSHRAGTVDVAGLFALTSELSELSVAGKALMTSYYSTAGMHANLETDLVSGSNVMAASSACSKMSFGEAASTLVINCVGASILVFPKVMADCGFVSAISLCIISAATSIQCGTLISDACTFVEQHFNVSVVPSFEALAFYIGGSKMRNVLIVTNNFVMVGSIVAYLQFVVDSFSNMIPLPELVIRFGIVWPLYAMLAMLTSLKQLARVANVGLLAVFLECGSIILGAIWRSFLIGACSPHTAGGCRWYTLEPAVPQSGWLGVWGKSAAVFLFSCAVLGTVPTVRSQIERPADMPRILRAAFSTICVINIIVMSLGYYGFGGSAPDNAAVELSKGHSIRFPVIGVVCSIAVLINMFISTPLCSFCFISVFESTGSDALRTPLTPLNIIFRASFMLVLSFVSWQVPYVIEVIGLISAVFVCCNNVFFPVVFIARAPGRPPLGITKQISLCITLLIGAYVLVFGFQGSLDTLMSKLAADHDSDKASASHEMNSLSSFSITSWLLEVVG